MAALPLHQRLQCPIQEVCSSHAFLKRKGENLFLCRIEFSVQSMVKMQSFLECLTASLQQCSFRETKQATKKVPHMHITSPLKLLKMWRQGQDTGNVKAPLLSFSLFLFPLSLSRWTDREWRETVTQLNQDYNPKI